MSKRAPYYIIGTVLVVAVIGFVISQIVSHNKPVEASGPNPGLFRPPVVGTYEITRLGGTYGNNAQIYSSCAGHIGTQGSYYMDINLLGAGDGDRGEPVYASGGGVVTTGYAAPTAQYPQNFGRYLILETDAGVTFRYAHLDSYAPGIVDGVHVNQGDKLGGMGDSGLETCTNCGVHLHWEAWITGTSDPYTDARYINGMHVNEASPCGGSGDTDGYIEASLVAGYTEAPPCVGFTDMCFLDDPPNDPNNASLLYQHCGYQGVCTQLSTSSSGLPINLSGDMNDLASSVRIPDGYSIKLFENANGGGDWVCLSGDETDFLDNYFVGGTPLGDRVSSYILYPYSNCGDSGGGGGGSGGTGWPSWLLEFSAAEHLPADVDFHSRVTVDGDYSAHRITINGQSICETSSSEQTCSWSSSGWSEGDYPLRVEYRRVSDNGNWSSALAYQTTYHVSASSGGTAPCDGRDGAELRTGGDCILITQSFADLQPIGMNDRGDLYIKVNGPYRAIAYDSVNYSGYTHTVESGQNKLVGGNVSSVDLQYVPPTPTPAPTATATQVFTMSTDLSQVNPGQTITVSWSNLSTTGNDWISMHPTSDLDNSGYLSWQYATTSNGSLQFTAPTVSGVYDFRMFRNGTKVGTSNSFTVVAPTATPMPTATNTLVPPTNTPTPYPVGSGTGLAAAYYNDMSMTNHVYSQVVSTVNVDTTGSVAPGVNAEEFSVLYLGWIQPQCTGLLTLYTNSDDGVRLFVNDGQLISNWTDHAAEENSGSFNAVAGQTYYVELQSYDNTEDYVMQLSWNDCGTKQIIPQSQLYPDTLIPLPTATPLPTSTETVIPASPTSTATSAPVATSTNTSVPQSVESVELLSGAITLSRSAGGAAEEQQAIDPWVFLERDALRITLDLNGICVLGGDASAVVVNQGGWKWQSFMGYLNQNCLDGQQTFYMSLADFSGLDRTQAVESLQFRVWYESGFEMIIQSVVAFNSTYGITNPVPTPIGATSVPTEEMTATSTATLTETPTLTPTFTSTPTETLTPIPPTATFTEVPSPTPQPTAVQAVELLTYVWHLEGSESQEESQGIAQDAFVGKTAIHITYNLHGLCALGNDASAIIVEQNGWNIISLSDYGTNCLDGLQTVTVPLSDFHNISGGANLDPNQSVGSLRVRFWYSTNYTVDIVSITTD